MRTAQLLCVAVLAVVTSRSGAQPSFTPLGFLPGGYAAVGLDISDDGAVVVGASDTLNPTQADGGWVWHRGIGYRFLPWRVHEFGTGAFSVSGNGTRIVGVTNDPYIPTANAASWNGATGALTTLGCLPGGDEKRALAWAVSRNGTTVVGTTSSALSGSQAFRIGSNGVMTGLGFFPDQDWTEAYGVSADGSVVVGGGYVSLWVFEPMYWTQEVGMFSLGRLPGSFIGYAYAVSDDGSVVIGDCEAEDPVLNNIFTHGFRWSNAGGMVELGPLPSGCIGSSALCMNHDGSLVGGSLVTDVGFSRAMLWDDAHGCRLFADVLSEAGLGQAVQGWTLTSITGMSADGSYFVGNGLAPGDFEMPFVVRLPRPAVCAADFDGSGAVTVQDIFDFLNAWFANDPRADFNGGGLSVQDIFDFLAAWFAGCP